MKITNLNRRLLLIAGSGFAALALAAGNVVSAVENSLTTPMTIDKKPFGKTADGKSVTLYTLSNDQGNSVELIDYGAIVVSINVPDRTGKRTNVTAGFSSSDGYLQRHPYFGGTVGRFCKRIAKGK